MSETRPSCARCGHPADHHDEGGASCWTRSDGSQTWGDDGACRCSWYEPDPLTERCCDEWPECSHVFAAMAEKHRQANPNCVCPVCVDPFARGSER